MIINSKAVAFLLATSICIITVAFLSLVDETPWTALFVAGALSFSSAFILISFTLEFLIFKEINNIYSELDKIKGDQSEAQPEKIKPSSNPIRRIKQEISYYTTQKEKEISELKQLEQYRKEFIANVSHELKTPIFAAQGYILTLLDGAMDDEKVRHKFLKKAAKSLGGLDVLVQDLLTISQIESGVITMKFEIFNLEMLVQDVFDQLENKSKKKGMEVFIEKGFTDDLNVYADYNRITQVFLNLLSNGIKYVADKESDDGKWVKVHFEDKGDNIEVTVADNGPGISQEHLGRIFERFYRVEKSRSKKQGGTGLGLSIVKHILEGHQSKITVDSQVGIGTQFSFLLKKASIVGEV